MTTKTTVPVKSDFSQEMREWIEAFDDVVVGEGPEQGAELLSALKQRARGEIVLQGSAYMMHSIIMIRVLNPTAHGLLILRFDMNAPLLCHRAVWSNSSPLAHVPRSPARRQKQIPVPVILQFCPGGGT